MSIMHFLIKVLYFSYALKSGVIMLLIAASQCTQAACYAVFNFPANPEASFGIGIMHCFNSVQIFRFVILRSYSACRFSQNCASMLKYLCNRRHFIADWRLHSTAGL